MCQIQQSTKGPVQEKRCGSYGYAISRRIGHQHMQNTQRTNDMAATQLGLGCASFDPTPNLAIQTPISLFKGNARCAGCEAAHSNDFLHDIFQRDHSHHVPHRAQRHVHSASDQQHVVCGCHEFLEYHIQLHVLMH